jgi:hypothetical protein
MTEDQIWLRQQHDRYADEIQRYRLFLGEAQDHRTGVAAAWTDACAKEMNGRFLNPMVEDARFCLDSMRLQHSALLQCGDGLVLAYNAFVRATESSAAVQAHISACAAVFRTIESFLSQSIAEQESANSHSEKTNLLCDEASRLGDSAPSESDFKG